jgi:uncharacterized spore protein YtfJ
MTTETMEHAETTVLDNMRGTRDAMSVRRVFGDAYELDGVTVIPVARVSGGGGGGGGEGTGPDDENGRGFGTGFGLGARPVGVYEVRNGVVEWKPSVDVNRLAKGGQVLAGIIAVCVTLVMMKRKR